MTIDRTTDAATEPVTSAEVEESLVISSGWDATSVTRKIEAARQQLENITDRSFVTQTWTMHLDEFPEVIYVPKGKLIAITSLKYDDSNGDEQTLAVTTDYLLANNGKKARISPVTSWPNTLSENDSVRLVYTAGYGNAAAVPGAIKDAIIALVEQLYSGKQDNQDMIDALINPYMIKFDYCING
tara:strand:+ start:8 stop:562 length:555 start_codon:yes stop_codon:yes gene_type:complete